MTILLKLTKLEKLNFRELYQLNMLKSQFLNLNANILITQAAILDVYI